MVVDGDNDDGDHHPHRHQGVAWSLEKIEVYEVRKTKKYFFLFNDSFGAQKSNTIPIPSHL